MVEDGAVKWFVGPHEEELPPWATERTDEHPQIVSPADRAPLLTDGQLQRACDTRALRWPR